jgi:hypothetical protein
VRSIRRRSISVAISLSRNCCRPPCENAGSPSSSLRCQAPSASSGRSSTGARPLRPKSAGTPGAAAPCISARAPEAIAPAPAADNRLELFLKGIVEQLMSMLAQEDEELAALPCKVQQPLLARAHFLGRIPTLRVPRPRGGEQIMTGSAASIAHVSGRLSKGRNLIGAPVPAAVVSVS